MAEPSPGPRRHKANLFRRGMGIAVCFAPAFLLIASIVSWARRQGGGSASLGFAVVGLLFGVLNSYLSVVRPWLYQRRRGSMECYQFISGLPLLGTLFVAVAGVLGFGELPTALVGLVALVLDTGGLPWFLVATWHDGSLWDA